MNFDTLRVRLRGNLGQSFGTSFGIAALAAIVGFGLPGCDARMREIRSGLSPDEVRVFDRGAELSSPCWACHDFYGTQNKVGPHLSGLYGRRAGESTFGAYSEALRQSGLVWDDATLDRFLANPQRFAPGTTMVSPGVANAADREALRFYIRHVTSAGS